MSKQNLKNLLSWVIAAGLSLVFVSTCTLFAYWTITRAVWWMCDLAVSIVFLQGVGYFLYGLGIQGIISRAKIACWLISLQSAIAYYVARALNRLVNRSLHLYVIPFDAYVGFLNTHSSLVETRQQLTCAEVELAVLRSAKTPAENSEVQS